VLRDRERGVFTDPDKVHHIGHEGEHFSVPGVHLVEPSIRRTPEIYQAGSSPRGGRFAAENAEAIFTAAPTKAMAKHITTTGAFYGFISHGLGQIWGMASGLLAAFAYVIFGGSLIGGCAYFANDAVNTIVGVNIPWLVFAIGAIVIIAALRHFYITLPAAILGVTPVPEVCVLVALAFSVIFKGGGPDGLMLDQTMLLNKAFESLPAGAFGTAAAGSMAIGLFFAFWSWWASRRRPSTTPRRATCTRLVAKYLSAHRVPPSAPRMPRHGSPYIASGTRP
jgi:hypothetical protein